VDLKPTPLVLYITISAVLSFFAEPANVWTFIREEGFKIFSQSAIRRALLSEFFSSIVFGIGL
jgi:hypothetical protein